MLTRIVLFSSILLLPAHSALDTPLITTTPTHTQEAELSSSPSLIDHLFQSTTSLLTSSWGDSEANSRQGPPGMIRITVGAFFAAILAAVLGVVGFGGVGLLALKALSVGSLALFLTLSSSLKHKSASDGQTVHYVPIHSGGGHHDYFHERSERLPTFMDRNM